MRHSLDRSALTPADKRALTTTKLAAILDLALAELGLERFAVEVSFVSDRKMRMLNREQRGKDKATDVLSFPMFEAKHARVRQAAWEKALPDQTLGAIVIAVGVARRQASEYSHSFADEVTRLIVHGVCHLAGYDHELSAREEKLMFAVEDRILGRLRARMTKKFAKKT
jgi:probable rRNA maturation factor